MLSHGISGTWLGGPREIERRREKKRKKKEGGRKKEKRERGKKEEGGGEERLLYLFDRCEGRVSLGAVQIRYSL